MYLDKSIQGPQTAETTVNVASFLFLEAEKTDQ